MNNIQRLPLLILFTLLLNFSPAMSEDYVPPEMPAYPKSQEEVMKALAPYYHDKRPMDFFFEMYVSDIIDELPKESATALEAFTKEYPSFFEESDGSWKRLVRESCKLSDTFEIAVLDLWIRNKKNAEDKDWAFQPRHFAQVFMEKYFEDESRVDVWEGDSLEAAKTRIQENKNS